MKAIKFLMVCGVGLFVLFMVSCSDGGGSVPAASRSVSMSVTDAKPLLRDNVTNLFVEFSAVWVHRSGEGWTQLALAQTPCTIDLLQFQDGSTTELVPPAVLPAGKYTQVRIEVSKATMRLNNDETTDSEIEIPNENLKTDKNFTIDLDQEYAVDIVIHFDLSMSVVASGQAPNISYKLKPVFHLFDDPVQALTISGSIDNSSFGDSEKATAIVLDSNGAVYTKVEIPKSATIDPTEFSIFWMVPDQTYTVQIDLNQDGAIDCNEFVEEVPVLEEGEAFFLNEGVAVTAGTDVCAP